MAREILTGKDRFAEYLSQGLDMEAICERTGLTQGQANAYMNRICADLGWQARG